MATVKANIDELRTYIAKAPSNNKTKIMHIIDLYEERRISNYETAISTVQLRASSHKNTLKSNKAMNAYNAVTNKYHNAEPRTGLVDPFKPTVEVIRDDYNKPLATTQILIKLVDLLTVSLNL